MVHLWLLLAHIWLHRCLAFCAKGDASDFQKAGLLGEHLESKGQSESCWPRRPLSKWLKIHWHSSFPFVNSSCVGGLSGSTAVKFRHLSYPWWFPRDVELAVSGVWNWLVTACRFQLCVSLLNSVCMGVKLVAWGCHGDRFALQKLTLATHQGFSLFRLDGF